MNSRRQSVLTAAVLWLAFAVLFQASAGLRASQGARITADEPFYLMTTHSMMTDGNLDLRDEYADESYREFYDHPNPLWHQSKPLSDGRELAPHQVGLSLLVLPAYAAGGLDAVKAFLAVLGGLAVALTFVLSFRLSAHYWASLVATVLVGSSAPVFVYSTQIYPEIPAALLALVALNLSLNSGRSGMLSVFCLAVAVAAIPWLGVKYAPLTAVLAAAALWNAGPLRVLLAGLLIAAAVGYVWFHLAEYGSLTPYSVNAIYAGDGTAMIVDRHFSFGDRLYRLVGLWTDREFGLLRWAPGMLLALPGAYFLLRQRPLAGGWLIAAFAGQLLVAAFVAITMRGWWFPGRQLIAVVPLLAVPMSFALKCWSRSVFAWSVSLGLTAYGVLVTYGLYAATSVREVTLAVNPWEMKWRVFSALDFIFPLYTTYAVGTWLLTAAWCSLFGALVWLAWRTSPARLPWPDTRRWFFSASISGASGILWRQGKRESQS